MLHTYLEVVQDSLKRQVTASFRTDDVGAADDFSLWAHCIPPLKLARMASRPRLLHAHVQILWVQPATSGGALQTHLEVVQDSLQLQVAARCGHVPVALQAGQAGIHRARLLSVSSIGLPLAALAAAHDMQSLQAGEQKGELQRVDVGHVGMLRPTGAQHA